jgi:hypothetical protein
LERSNLPTVPALLAVQVSGRNCASITIGTALVSVAPQMLAAWVKAFRLLMTMVAAACAEPAEANALRSHWDRHGAGHAILFEFTGGVAPHDRIRNRIFVELGGDDAVLLHPRDIRLRGAGRLGRGGVGGALGGAQVVELLCSASFITRHAARAVVFKTLYLFARHPSLPHSAFQTLF